MVERGRALRRGVRLERLTVAWMLVEAALALGAGVAARSVLLTAFGFDSVVELMSGFVLLRRLSVEADGSSVVSVERLEKTTARISAVLLAALCAFVALTSAAGLVFRVKPDGSVLGLVVAAAATAGMPALAWAKSRANRTIGSASLRADVAESVTCAYMAAVTLCGVGASMLFGLWWLQYVGALGLLVWLVPEAREAFEAAGSTPRADN
ncbi:MAG TPA: cation transporter [Candidatus Sulfotelmatobacter sp.]|nr:cation transporter [Candidatus Sulfotelmatobacter sp.]